MEGGSLDYKSLSANKAVKNNLKRRTLTVSNPFELRTSKRVRLDITNDKEN